MDSETKLLQEIEKLLIKFKVDILEDNKNTLEILKSQFDRKVDIIANRELISEEVKPKTTRQRPHFHKHNNRNTNNTNTNNNTITSTVETENQNIINEESVSVDIQDDNQIESIQDNNLLDDLSDIIDQTLNDQSDNIQTLNDQTDNKKLTSLKFLQNEFNINNISKYIDILYTSSELETCKTKIDKKHKPSTAMFRKKLASTIYNDLIKQTPQKLQKLNELKNN